jgi:hypothetical protein
MRGISPISEFSSFLRRQPIMLFKKLCEIFDVPVSDFLGNLVNLFVRIAQNGVGGFDTELSKVFCKRNACIFFEKGAKIRGMKIEPFG